MNFSGFIQHLHSSLKGPLPGLPAQIEMATVARMLRNGKITIPDDARKGGVLILFYPFDGHQVNLVLIKRTEYPGVHSGQISFPGGSWEEGDADMIATALRETEEEIGVNKNSVKVLGKLSELFIPPSNFLVTPVIGYLSDKTTFKPDYNEVDKILEISMKELLNDDSRQEKEINIFPSVKVRVPCFYIDGNIIWGATAMILNELIKLISRES
jgi:8-oxo-dGTP pyrophosphatase MutT (NUDIX family)